jgi:hypothetical protein
MNSPKVATSATNCKEDLLQQEGSICGLETSVKKIGREIHNFKKSNPKPVNTSDLNYQLMRYFNKSSKYLTTLKKTPNQNWSPSKNSLNSPNKQAAVKLNLLNMQQPKSFTSEENKLQPPSNGQVKLKKLQLNQQWMIQNSSLEMINSGSWLRSRKTTNKIKQFKTLPEIQLDNSFQILAEEEEEISNKEDEEISTVLEGEAEDSMVNPAQQFNKVEMVNSPTLTPKSMTAGQKTKNDVLRGGVDRGDRREYANFSTSPHRSSNRSRSLPPLLERSGGQLLGNKNSYSGNHPQYITTPDSKHQPSKISPFSTTSTSNEKESVRMGAE